MSEFLNRAYRHASDHTSKIEFDDATKLRAAGSTCDLYRTRWQRREVFVKRLKEEYRAKPLYLDALDKEFEIGVTLKHPSLPVYHAFGRDYIIMDYIDGTTLADMIRMNDERLTKEKNIVKLLNELIAVVEYLHRHNVVHCDIKADNIMVTANNSNLVLIDFDKSYTDALCDTSGHPSKYGLSIDNVGRSGIDFHAIGMLVEKLKKEVHGFKMGKYKQFVGACYKRDANCEDLKEILAASGTSTNKLGMMMGIGVGLIAIGLLIGLIGYRQESGNSPAAVPTPDEVKDEITDDNKEDFMADFKEDNISSDKAVSSEPAAISQEQIHDDARRKAELLDQRIQPSFNILLADLDRLQALKNDSTLSRQQLLDSIRRHSNLADEYIAEAFEILKETFPGLNDRETWRIMSYSKAYTGYTRRATPELTEYGKEIERRLKEEGK